MAIRKLIWLALLFTAAVALAIAGQLDTGHVVIVYASRRIDIALNFFIIALLLTFLALYTLIWLFNKIWQLPKQIAVLHARMQSEKAQGALRESLRELFAGRFTRAEKAAQRALSNVKNQSAASLIGASAAHRLREYARRDEWLKRVHGAKWQIARSLAYAEMLAEVGDAKGALAALEEIPVQDARRIHAQRIALRAHQQLKHWPDVLRIVRALEKRGVLESATASRLRQLAAENLLGERRYNPQALLSCWQALPASERHAPRVADFAAELHISLQAYKKAQQIIEEALASQWDARLLRRYPACAGADPMPLIEQAETWRAKHPDDPALLFALGQLCMQQQLWGKAQAFFEGALKFSSDDKTQQKELHCALARLHEELGHESEANQHYRASALA